MRKEEFSSPQFKQELSGDLSSVLINKNEVSFDGLLFQLDQDRSNPVLLQDGLNEQIKPEQ